MNLNPVVQEFYKKKSIVGIEYYLYSKKWDKYFYEYSSGIGKDARTAVGMSTSSFLFAFMDGLRSVYMKDNPISMNTEFGGNKHTWNVYLSNIVGTGNKGNDNTNHTIYWELLEDEIKKRLGNQKLVYVKVYAGQYPGKVVGEVCFDDKPIPKLSKMVEELAEKWETSLYSSEKQFFFIEQTPETVTPSDYDGVEGQKLMRSKVVKYLKLFQSATTDELYDQLLENAKKELGDDTLAFECFSFLPQIVVKRALDDEQIEIPDNILIGFSDGSSN